MNAGGGIINVAASSRQQALSQTWFSGAPVTKFITFVLAAMHIAAEMSGLHDALALGKKEGGVLVFCFVMCTMSQV